MAMSLDTNRLAKDYNRAMHLHMQGTVTNYSATQWAPTPASTSVANTNGGAKDAICATFDSNWSNSAPWVWSFTKHASNPLVAQQYGAQYEFYPPYPLKDGTDYRLCAKCNGDSYGYTSTDGVIWASDGKFITKGTAGQWDATQSSGNVVKKVGSTYYIFYSGYASAPYNHKIGLVTNTAWDTNFTKEPSYVYTVSDYNTANGTSWNGISLTDIVLVGTTYYYFGTVYANTEDSGALCYGVGQPGGAITSIKLDTKICNFSDLNSVWTWAQGLSVFKHPVSGKWILTFTLGNLTATGTDNQAIYCFYSNRTDAPVFTISDFFCKPIMYPDTSKDYENNYNYAANWLKDEGGNLLQIDSKYHLYYSGHKNGASPTYTGVTCLATCTSIPQT